MIQPSSVIPGLYVHVPFCRHKCHYCDFYSITRQSQERQAAFVRRILAEADQWVPSLRPRTVFFGGGTPTLLAPELMRQLIEGLRARFDFSQLEEWTIEANPATVDADYCRMLRELGVDRLSFGAQSFDPDELRVLERNHAPGDVERSLDAARAAGFERLNLDLIFAIPGQTLESWRRNLETAVSLGMKHLSCYGLTYEPGTALETRRRRGQVQPAEESLELDMLRLTRAYLRSVGIPPYEISNFAAPGEECRHNLLYWRGGDYAGLGPAAASHIQGRRWRNTPNLGAWEAGIDHGQPAIVDAETLTPLQRAGELAMLMLRLEEGLVYADFAARSGFDARAVYADPIARLTQQGLLEDDGQRLRLTDEGLRVADAVAAEFIAAA